MSRASRLLAAALLGMALPATAQQAPAPSYGYDLPWKLTVAGYRAGSDTSLDVNLRRKFDDLSVWVGGYLDPHGDGVVRFGAEYGFDWGWLRVTPTLQTATNGFFGGQVYAEAGRSVYVIAGYSQTNEKDFANLTFDPNESVQLGLGAKLDSKTRLNAFTIFDVRLDTGQQTTHAVLRRYLDEGHRITADVVYKSGHTDEDEFVRGLGVTVTYDWPRFFVRLAYDPYVNFTDDTMLRLGAGIRF